MFRTLFVVGLIGLGLYYSLYGPFYILLFYLWNAYFRPEYWVWYDFVSALNLSFLLGVALTAAILFHANQLRWSGRLLLIGLFFVQSSISLLQSEHFGWSWVYWVEFSKVLLVSFSIPLLVTDKHRYRLTLLVIAYSLGFEAAKQGWAQLILNPGAQNSNPHPVLGDNNGVGFGMMMLIPVFAVLAQTASSRWEKYLHQFFIAGLFYRGISTYSRGAFLSAAVLGLLVLMRSPRKLRAAIAMTVLSTVVVLAMPDQFWNRMSTITASDEERDASQQGRLYFWRIAMRMAAAKPLTGVGLNAFRPSFRTYDTSGGLFGEDRAAHSAWFGVLAEMGYPGLVLFVALFLATLLRCSRMARSDPSRSDSGTLEIRRYAIGLQTSLVVYAVGVTFLNGQYNEMYWHFVGLSLALGWIGAKHSPTIEERLPTPETSTAPSQRARPLAASAR